MTNYLAWKEINQFILRSLLYISPYHFALSNCPVHLSCQSVFQSLIVSTHLLDTAFKLYTVIALIEQKKPIVFWVSWSKVKVKMASAQ